MHRNVDRYVDQEITLIVCESGYCAKKGIVVHLRDIYEAVAEGDCVSL